VTVSLEDLKNGTQQVSPTSTSVDNQQEMSLSRLWKRPLAQSH